MKIVSVMVTLQRDNDASERMESFIRKTKQFAADVMDVKMTTKSNA